jgi:hypothetical protein
MPGWVVGIGQNQSAEWIELTRDRVRSGIGLSLFPPATPIRDLFIPQSLIQHS